MTPARLCARWPEASAHVSSSPSSLLLQRPPPPHDLSPFLSHRPVVASLPSSPPLPSTSHGRHGPFAIVDSGAPPRAAYLARDPARADLEARGRSQGPRVPPQRSNSPPDGSFHSHACCGCGLKGQRTLRRDAGRPTAVCLEMASERELDPGYGTAGTWSGRKEQLDSDVWFASQLAPEKDTNRPTRLSVLAWKRAVLTFSCLRLRREETAARSRARAPVRLARLCALASFLSRLFPRTSQPSGPASPSASLVVHDG